MKTHDLRPKLREIRTPGALIRDATTGLDKVGQDAHVRAQLVAVAREVGQK
jgi:hypothetical protein